MKKKLAGTWKKNIGDWPVQINGNKFATSQILKKPVEVEKGRILAGWAQKSPEPWTVAEWLRIPDSRIKGPGENVPPYKFMIESCWLDLPT
jgi:hypothetical protein